MWCTVDVCVCVCEREREVRVKGLAFYYDLSLTFLLRVNSDLFSSVRERLT